MDAVPDRTRDTLALFLETSRSFHELVDVEALLPVMMEKLKSLLGAEASSIILYDPGRDEFYFPVSTDERLDASQRIREVRFPASQGISGVVLREGRSMLVPDVSREPRFYQAVTGAGSTSSSSATASTPGRSVRPGTGGGSPAPTVCRSAVESQGSAALGVLVGRRGVSATPTNRPPASGGGRHCSLSGRAVGGAVQVGSIVALGSGSCGVMA